MDIVFKTSNSFPKIYSYFILQNTKPIFRGVKYMPLIKQRINSRAEITSQVYLISKPDSLNYVKLLLVVLVKPLIIANKF